MGNLGEVESSVDGSGMTEEGAKAVVRLRSQMQSARRRRSQISILAVGLVCIASAWGFTSYKKSHRFAGTENYEISFPTTYAGWKAMPHSPQTKFLFVSNDNKYLLRGAVSQIISEVNPTPDLTTDGLADYYIERTRENMPNWTAEKLDDINGVGDRFSVIKRKGLHKTVVTAFCSKGNTTLMVTVSSHSLSDDVGKACADDLRDYVRNVNLTETDMGGGLKSEIEADQAANLDP